MKISSSTIEAALERHLSIYGQRWTIPHHIEMWSWAQQAFSSNDSAAFEKVYEELRKRWQVFRGNKVRPSPAELFATLRNLNQRFSKRTLSSLGEADVIPMWALIKSMANIKRLKLGPSIMATSKFLHFWNPRLFVIADQAMMMNWVFKHHWVRLPISRMHATLRETMPAEVSQDPDYRNGLGRYLSILFWCGELARNNPCVVSEFSRYIYREGGNARSLIPTDSEMYEAAAVEWFLLGAVELSPEGIAD